MESLQRPDSIKPDIASDFKFTFSLKSYKHYASIAFYPTVAKQLSEKN